MSIKGFTNWTRSNLMKFETMAALAGGLAVSASLPGLAQSALARLGFSLDLTSGYRATVSSLALAGLGGYALYSIAGVSSSTASLFTVAAMVPAALSALNNMGLTFLPTVHVSGDIFGTTAGLLGLGNADTVMAEPMFGNYDMAPISSGDMFGLGGKEINLF